MSPHVRCEEKRKGRLKVRWGLGDEDHEKKQRWGPGEEESKKEKTSAEK